MVAGSGTGRCCCRVMTRRSASVSAAAASETPSKTLGRSSSATRRSFGRGEPGTERSRVLPVTPQIGATGGKAGLGQARRQAQHLLLRAAVAVGQGDGPGR